MKQKTLNALWLANSFFQFFKSIIIGYLCIGFGIYAIGLVLVAIKEFIKNAHN